MATRFDPSKRTHEVHSHDYRDDGKYSHFIPAYPDYKSDTDFNTIFYDKRRDQCDRLVGLDIIYDREDGINIGNVIIIGAYEVLDGETETFKADFEGDADDTVVTWSTSNPSDVIVGNSITFNGDGDTTVTATVTSATAIDSPQVATKVVKVKGAPSLDTLSSKPSTSTGGTLNYGTYFSTQLQGLDAGYTTEDYLHFYTVVGSNTTQNSVSVYNSSDNYPYWAYDGNKVINNNTPCIVTETFTLKTDPSVTAAINCTFYLRNT